MTHLIDQLTSLRLHGMAEAAQDLLAQNRLRPWPKRCVISFRLKPVNERSDPFAIACA